MFTNVLNFHHLLSPNYWNNVADTVPQIQCNPMHLYSEVSLTTFSGACCLVTMLRIAAKVSSLPVVQGGLLVLQPGQGREPQTQKVSYGGTTLCTTGCQSLWKMQPQNMTLTSLISPGSPFCPCKMQRCALSKNKNQKKEDSQEIWTYTQKIHCVVCLPLA